MSYRLLIRTLWYSSVIPTTSHITKVTASDCPLLTNVSVVRDGARWTEEGLAALGPTRVNTLISFTSAQF